MHINHHDNYISLESSLKNDAWCYSLDGYQINAASTLWEKIRYIGRTIILSNGSSETMQSAILHSFSPVDRALIEAKLKNREIEKRNRKIQNIWAFQMGSVDPESESLPHPKKDIESLAAEAIDNISSKELLTDPIQEEVFSSEDLRSLAKVHKVFKDISSLSREVIAKKEVVDNILAQKIHSCKIIECEKFFDKILSTWPAWEMQEPRDPLDINLDFINPFLKIFVSKELQPTSANKFLKEYKDSLINFEKNYKKTDQAKEQLSQLATFLQQADHCLENIGKLVEENPTDNMVAFKKAFESYVFKTKNRLIKETLRNMYILERYAAIGSAYGRAITFDCMKAYSKIPENDIQLYKTLRSEWISQCELCRSFSTIAHMP